MSGHLFIGIGPYRACAFCGTSWRYSRAAPCHPAVSPADGGE